MNQRNGHTTGRAGTPRARLQAYGPADPADPAHQERLAFMSARPTEAAHLPLWLLLPLLLLLRLWLLLRLLLWLWLWLWLLLRLLLRLPFAWPI
jgi:hypothetical protein